MHQADTRHRHYSKLQKFTLGSVTNHTIGVQARMIGNGLLPNLSPLTDVTLAPTCTSWPELLPLSRDQQSARPRQTIYRAGDLLDGVPVICDGWAARVIRLSDGRRQI